MKGEEPLEAAKRELWEEADLVADEWNVLVDYFTSPGGSTEGLRIFLARGVKVVPEGSVTSVTTKKRSCPYVGFH